MAVQVYRNIIVTCLSTDTKITGIDGNMLRETDTGKMFLWEDGKWVQMLSQTVLYSRAMVLGLQGEEGDEGQMGPRGVTGAKGDTGLPGDPGEQGPSGAMGPTGKGIPGIDGEDGIDGFPGLAGVAGASGSAGVTGPAGMRGFDGEDGEDGFISDLSGNYLAKTSFSGLTKISVGTVTPPSPGTGDLWVDCN